jgi:hypothetical protein
LRHTRKSIDAYPSHDAGMAARYHLAGVYLSMGRAAEAATLYADVASRGGSSVYGAAAKLGQAQALVAQTKYDDAIKILTDLSAQRDSELPMDGVLMELARVCQRGGKAAGSPRRLQAGRRLNSRSQATPAKRVSSWRLWVVASAAVQRRSANL